VGFERPILDGIALEGMRLIKKYVTCACANGADLEARLLDLPKPGFEAVLTWVLDFRRQLMIPHTLAEIGVNTNNSAVIGTEAAADPSAGGNPVALDAGTLERLFRSAVVRDLTLRG
jgi:alcohol dehydrogenase class IV